MKGRLPQEVRTALEVAQEKQAVDPVLLHLAAVTTFTDYFLILGVRNPRQGQAISDEIELRSKKRGLHHPRIEGYPQGEWILLDYGFLVVHILSEKARQYYDLERLWRTAPKLAPDAAD
jgi:ribosome-associated protein